MNGTIQADSSDWTRRRFLGVAAILFVLQAALIILFGSKEIRSARATTFSTQFRALPGSINEEELLRLFFATDPAVFSWPTSHGFSGRAWMDAPPVEFQSASQLEPPRWLPLDTMSLGSGFIAANRALFATPFSVARLNVPGIEPLPVFLPVENVSTQSVFQIDGPLNARLLDAPLALRSWPSAQLLTNTVVQIAVNPSGDVLAARLVARCGSADADADALSKARALRFRPGASAGTTWARAIFQWQTTAPATAAKTP
jgi:hypothetical protein